MKTSTLLLFIGLLAVPTSGGEAPEIILWPTEARPQLAVERHRDTFDGVPITVTEFVGAGLRIRTDSSGDWIGGGSSGNRYSLRLSHYQSPDILLSFAIFEANEFLPSLSSSAWQAYLEGLRQQYGATLTRLEETNQADGSGDVFLFGRPYREIYYTVQPDPQAVAVTYREIFAFVGTKLMVVTVEAPPEIMPRMVLPVDRFLARMELIN